MHPNIVLRAATLGNPVGQYNDNPYFKTALAALMPIGLFGVVAWKLLYSPFGLSDLILVTVFALASLLLPWLTLRAICRLAIYERGMVVSRPLHDEVVEWADTRSFDLSLRSHHGTLIASLKKLGRTDLALADFTTCLDLTSVEQVRAAVQVQIEKLRNGT